MKLNGQIDILNGQIESHQAAMAGVKLDLQVRRTAELCQPWLPVSIVHGLSRPGTACYAIWDVAALLASPQLA